MTTVKQIIEGYAKKTATGWLASCSTILIKDSSKNILVDPGINKELLLKKLNEENLTPDDINIVFLTHYHLDHIFLVAVFEKAIVADGATIYTKDLEEEYAECIPGTTIKLLQTPGHANEHTSLIVNINNEITVVAQDVFWWTESEEQKVDNYDLLINKEDPFVLDFDQLKESRKKILTIADYIIPGHGKIFKNIHKHYSKH